MIRAALVGLAMVLAGPGAAQQTEQAPGGVLRVLDKLTGTTRDVEMRAGTVARFGRLNISMRECRYPAGNRAGDAYAGLEIHETGNDEPMFNGWMIASAPALSALDHPQYDVWVIRCITTS